MHGRTVLVIDKGSAGDVDLAGQPIAISFRYSDDEPESPWTWALYLDERATDEQRDALEAIFTGRLGGKPTEIWARGPFEFIGTRTAQIVVDRTPRRQFLRVRDHVTLTIRGRHEQDAVVSCGIPGHEQPGEELIADVLEPYHDDAAASALTECRPYDWLWRPDCRPEDNVLRF